MKKRTQMIGKSLKYAAVATLSVGLLTFNACKKDSMTEIKVEDSEDVEKTNQELGVTELEKKYEELASSRADSLAHVLDMLELEHENILDDLERRNEVGIDKALADYNLTDKANEAQMDAAERDSLFVVTLESKKQALELEILKTKLETAKNDKDIAAVAIEIQKAEANASNEILLSTQEVLTQLANEESLTNAQLLLVQKSIQNLSKDSITNAYTIMSDIVGMQEDSIADHYSFLATIADELDQFIQDTAEMNKDQVLALDAFQKELILTTLEKANEHLNAIQAENDAQLVRVLDAKLTAERNKDNAQKAYDDYVASKDIIDSEERTELTVVIMSQAPNGDEVLLPAGATITLDGIDLPYADGSAIAVGDLEGDHFITIEAAGHLKTQFALNIAEVASNDDADGFEMLEKRIVVKMLQSDASFTVQGFIEANTMDYEFWDGTTYSYLEDAGVFEAVTTPALSTSISKDMAKRDAENGTDEPVAVNLSVKVTGSVASADYIPAVAGLTVSSFTMENTTAITTSTDAADGSYELAGIPVLNDDFTVEILVENIRINQKITFYGENTANEQVTRVVTDNTQTVQNQKIVLAPATRVDGVTLFEDKTLF